MTQLFAMFVMVAGVLIAPVSAQDQGTALVAVLVTGTCEAPVEVVAPLSESTLPNESDVAVPAASGYATAPIGLETVLATPHALQVLRSADGVVVTCGDIGGAIDATGALVIGLQPMNDSGLAGIAYLSPGAANQIGISTFITTVGAVATGSEPLDEASYATRIRSHITLVVGSLQRVDVLFENPSIQDESWQNQVLAELSLWQMLYREAEATVPPAQYADFHARYVAAIAKLDSASHDIVTGLETGDQALLDQANAKITEAVTDIRALDNAGETASPAAATPAS